MSTLHVESYVLCLVVALAREKIVSVEKKKDGKNLMPLFILAHGV